SPCAPCGRKATSGNRAGSWAWESSIEFECLRTRRHTAYGAPDAFRRRRHFHMAYTEFAERVHDCIDGDGECRCRPTFAGRTNAERMGWRRHFADAGVEKRKYVRPRHGVVHERAR